MPDGRKCPMKTITRQQLKAKLDAGTDIKLVMTVGGWTFRARHSAGSVSSPSPSCALRELRRDDEIIVYATSQHRQATVAAFDALTAHGYRNVCCYLGGLADWEDAGYPVEGEGVGSTAQRPPHGHSPGGRELRGGCPPCDNGWSGYGWPPAGTADHGLRDGHQPEKTGTEAALAS